MKPQRPSGRRSASAQIAAWAFLVALITGLSLRGWGTFQVGAYQDDAIYVVLAHSIAFGERYGLINQPGAPGRSKFPFGFPLVLAPLVRAVPDDPVVCTLIPLAATLLSISLLFWGWPLLGRGSSRWWGLAGASLYGLSPLGIGQTRIVLSEPYFMSLVLTALLLAEAQVRNVRAWHWRMPALGVVLMATVFTRWIGLVVCGAVVLRLAWAARVQCLKWFAAMLAGAFVSLSLLLLLTPIELQQLAPGNYLTSRHDRLQLLDERRARSESPKTPARYLTAEIRSVLLAAGGGNQERQLAQNLGVSFLPQLIGVGISALVVCGGWLGARRLAPAVLLFEILYAGALLFWPFVNARLLYPLIPFFYVQLLGAVHAVGAAAGRRIRRGTLPLAGSAVAATFAILAGLSLIKSASIEDSRTMTGDLRLGPTWLARHTPSDAVVLAQTPQTAFLYGRRETLPYPTRSRAALDQILADWNIDYLLLEPELKWRPPQARIYSPYVKEALAPMIAKLAAQGRLSLAYEAPAEPLVRVYRVEQSMR